MLKNTAHPHELVCVDGGSPPEIRDYMRTRATERNFKLIRTEHLLSPNEARNLALAEVKTEFVVFVDNDVTVDSGWLEKLVACADETGAWIVGPLYMIGPPGTEVIHMAGGDMRIEEDNGRRVFHERHRLANQRLSEHKHALRREPVDMVEFHTMLVRREAFDHFGPMDEKLLSADEHADLCLLVNKHGGAIYFEPESRVTYTPSHPKGAGDRAYHLLRWSPDWNSRTLDHFAKKWELDRQSLRQQWRWLTKHRLAIYRRFGSLDSVIRPLLTWREQRKRARHGTQP